VALDLAACEKGVSGADQPKGQEGPAEQNQHVSPLPCRPGRCLPFGSHLIARRRNR
jgi:hypothetical protein